MASEQQDPGALADEMEQEADRLEDRSTDLGQQVDDVRTDWERKRADQGVPGANPPDGDVSDGSADRDESANEGSERDESDGSAERDESANEGSERDESGDQTSGQGSDVPPDREAGDG